MNAAAAILERLDRIEAALARLAPRHAVARPDTPPARVSKAQAARVLGCSTDTIDRYAARGLLVKLPKRTPKCATFFHPDNVASLAQSEAHAREWVAARKYCPKTLSRRK